MVSSSASKRFLKDFLAIVDGFFFFLFFFLFPVSDDCRIPGQKELPNFMSRLCSFILDCYFLHTRGS